MANDPIVHVIDDDDAARDALRFLLSVANFSVPSPLPKPVASSLT
jgi:FixJ family two-component response regulator